MPGGSPVNTDESELALFRAERRVREIQTKLHRWARGDPHRRFDDLFNLVADPAFLRVAWDRVRSNKGARTAGVDGATASSLAARGVEVFLDELRSQVKDRSFCPLPVRERMIPKAGGKRRRLGIATVRDRVVQASLKLVLEPIFEADFLPCSYGFRPRRRTHDAVAEVRHLTSHSYEWVVEGDIKSCFDDISHSALMARVRKRVGDKRVLALVKAFLKADILGEDRALRSNDAGTPQGSILSPLLSNVALSVLDEHVAQSPGGPSISAYQRAKRRSQGLPNYRLIRYADDWCLVISGTKTDAEVLREEIAGVLSTIGLRLSPEKTLIRPALMRRATFAASFRTNASNASGLSPATSRPSWSRRCLTSGSASVLFTCSLSFSTIARGSFGGPDIPNHTIASASLMPDSASVGTSGRRGLRFVLAMPITLLL